MVSPKQAYALAKDAKYQTFAKCYERYAAQIRAYNALDFDDLIMLPTFTLQTERRSAVKMAGENSLSVGG